MLLPYDNQKEEVKPTYQSHWHHLTCEQKCENAGIKCYSDCTEKFNQADNNCTQLPFSLGENCIKVRHNQESCYDACEVMESVCKSSCK